MPYSAAVSKPRRIAAGTAARSRHVLSVVEPFRLDLTATALRRVPTNAVDVLTPAGEYFHAFTGAHGPLIARVVQQRSDALDLTVEGGRDSAEHERVAALVGRTLGVDRDLTPFYESARRIRWLAPLAQRMRGIKPPRYRDLWEAFVNAVVFQQVSLHAATAVVRRMVTTLGTPAGVGVDTPLYVFPDVDRVLRATDADLRATGLSTAKIATLRRAGEAIGSGTLTEEMIEERSSAEAAALLQQLKGIGPWTATVILLRGFGRLDVFPGNDSGVARNLALLATDAPLDLDEVLAALGPQRGMLYFHLLLARLEMRGEVGRGSIPWR